MIQPSLATRKGTEIVVRVHDKQAGARFATLRAEMLLRPGEKIKLMKKRYPHYIYAVKVKE